MGQTVAFKKAVAAIEGLTRADLEKLQGVISTLLTEGYLDTEAQGSIELKYITRKGKKYGPYRYRRVWRDGKLISIYEGKAE